MAQSSVLSQLHQELAILIADSTYVNRQLTINPPKGADSLTRQTVPWCLARGSLLQLFDATSGSLPGQLDSAYSEHSGLFRPFLYHRRSRAAAREYLFTFLFSHCPVMLLPLPFDKPTYLAHPPTGQTLSNSQEKVKGKTLCSQFTSAIFTSQISCLKRQVSTQASYHLLPFPPALNV